MAMNPWKFIRCINGVNITENEEQTGSNERGPLLSNQNELLAFYEGHVSKEIDCYLINTYVWTRPTIQGGY